MKRALASSPFRLLGVVLGLGGLVCLVLSLTAWGDSFGIQGAYFDRAVGAPAYAGIFSYGDARMHYVLRGAAIGLAGAAALVLAVDLWVSRRPG